VLKTWPAAGLVFGTFFTPAVWAQTADPVLSADLRVRAETVDAEGDQGSADALTLRLRPTLEADLSPEIGVLVEGEFIAGLLPDRRNAPAGMAGPAPIPDRETAEFNRLQVQWRPDPRLSLTAGRQAISLKDERFIGTVDFRQNQQTYDALTLRFRDPGLGVTFETGQIWQVNRFLGARDANGVFDSDSWFLDLGANTPVGTASLFHVDLDLETDGGLVERSRTTGLRVEGRWFGEGMGVFWTFSGAVQDRGAGAQPGYGLADLSLEVDRFTLRGRFEHLGSDGETAFQTPLATLHRFQGAADVFTTTPDTGLNDLQFSLEWRLGSVGEYRGVRLAGQFNDFRSEDGETRLGREIGFGLSAGLRGSRVSLEVADYDAKRFGADTRKVWLTVSRRF